MSAPKTYSIPLHRLCITAGKVSSAITRHLIEWDYRLQKVTAQIKELEAASVTTATEKKVTEIQGIISGIEASIASLENGHRLFRLLNGKAIHLLQRQREGCDLQLESVKAQLNAAGDASERLSGLRKRQEILSTNKRKAFATALDVSTAYVHLSALNKMGQKTIRVPRYTHGDLKSQIKAIMYASKTVEIAQDRLADQIARRKLGQNWLGHVEGSPQSAVKVAKQQEASSVTPMRRTA